MSKKPYLVYMDPCEVKHAARLKSPQSKLLAGARELTAREAWVLAFDLMEQERDASIDSTLEDHSWL